MVLVRGSVAHYKERKGNGAFVFTLGGWEDRYMHNNDGILLISLFLGKAKSFLLSNWRTISADYTLPIKRKKLDEGEPSFEITVTRSKKLRLPVPLSPGAKYRVNLNAFARQMPKFQQRIRVGFRLVRAADPAEEASVARAARDEGAKSFITNR